jgi:hypothetical protein
MGGCDWHWTSCPSKEEWRTKQAMTFSARLITLHTQPGLRIILMRAFCSLLATGDCSFPDAIFSATETILVDSQTAISWQHIIFGCFSIEWSHMQESHAQAEKLDPEIYTGKSWMAKVTKHIWRAFRALWLLRNADLHGTTFAKGKPVKRAHLEPLVTHIYAHIHQLNPSDRNMLHHMPLAEQQALPLSCLLTWLSSIQPAFEEARIREDHDFNLKEALALNLEIEAAIAVKAELQAEG